MQEPPCFTEPLVTKRIRVVCSGIEYYHNENPQGQNISTVRQCIHQAQSDIATKTLHHKQRLVLRS